VRCAADRFAAALPAPSDIREALPRLHREASRTILELGVRGANSTTTFLAGLEQRGGILWSVDVEPACDAIFHGHPQWRFVWADSRDVGTLRGLFARRVGRKAKREARKVRPRRR
jgi:hypothetical protein